MLEEQSNLSMDSLLAHESRYTGGKRDSATGRVAARRGLNDEAVRGETMAIVDTEDTTLYKVVVNHEEQYSLWPADRENPLGWIDAGKCGPKPDCLEYIASVWTDMRPLSVRIQMAQNRAESAPT